MPPLVLVVEDDPSVRELVAGTLRAEGYDVMVAADGLVALELVAARRPDLVLTDVVMPNLSGPELYARLRVRGFAGPVVLISEHLSDGMQPGDPVLRKPIRLAALVHLVAEVLPMPTA